MELDYLMRRHADATARAASALSAPARIAHQRMARGYADRIAAEKRSVPAE
ncbi:hypothetical protein FHS95_001355 [Sphingomonas naasensis]|uniref:hypothetical protein n=1 Tax=Sphingomonas naasensis TaxID=1344951 RepID=UPI00141A6994|nr:hypothetical protein [Sphingomonas naasensis]NIJ19686.1 hypothetical protein [Sphingomonas naasensis]